MGSLANYVDRDTRRMERSGKTGRKTDRRASRGADRRAGRGAGRKKGRKKGRKTGTKSRHLLVELDSTESQSLKHSRGVMHDNRYFQDLRVLHGSYGQEHIIT